MLEGFSEGGPEEGGPDDPPGGPPGGLLCGLYLLLLSVPLPAEGALSEAPGDGDLPLPGLPPPEPPNEGAAPAVAPVVAEAVAGLADLAWKGAVLNGVVPEPMLNHWAVVGVTV